MQRTTLSNQGGSLTNCDVSNASTANQKLGSADRGKTEQCIRNSATSRNQDTPAPDSLTDPAVFDARSSRYESLS